MAILIGGQKSKPKVGDNYASLAATGGSFQIAEQFHQSLGFPLNFVIGRHARVRFKNAVKMEGPLVLAHSLRVFGVKSANRGAAHESPQDSAQLLINRKM